VRIQARGASSRACFLSLLACCWAQMDEPLWIPSVSLPGSLVKETLNFKEYSRAFTPCIGLKPAGFVSEASRKSGIVVVDSSAALVEAFMDEVLLVQLCPFIYLFHCLCP
jgi:hypothetical protein